MTVRELIIKLLDQDMDAVVLVLHPTGYDGDSTTRTPELLTGFASSGGFTNPHDWLFDPRSCPDESYVPAVVLLEEVY